MDGLSLLSRVATVKRWERGEQICQCHRPVTYAPVAGLAKKE
jgi:hypothetical protein